MSILDVKGIVTAFIASILTALLFWAVNIVRNYLKSRKREYDYIWKPETPLVNDLDKLKPVTEYKSTWKLIIKEKADGFDIHTDPREMINGFEAFKQHLILLLNTEKDKYKVYEGTNYGVSYILTDARNNEEFNSMAFVVAKEIMKIEEEWIKEIYSIKKVKNKNIIVLELGLKGIHEIVKINAIVIPSKMRSR